MKKADRTFGQRAAPLTALLLGLCLWAGVSVALLAKAKPLAWKALDNALLQVNGEPPKDWSVLQASKKGLKKNDDLLLQLGNRFLLIHSHEHQVFELDPATVKHQADELLWSPDDRPAQPVPSEWTTEDLGSAFRLAFTLPRDSLSFDLQIEHPPDVGDLPAHAAAPATNRRRY